MGLWTSLTIVFEEEDRCSTRRARRFVFGLGNHLRHLIDISRRGAWRKGVIRGFKLCVESRCQSNPSFSHSNLLTRSASGLTQGVPSISHQDEAFGFEEEIQSGGLVTAALAATRKTKDVVLDNFALLSNGTDDVDMRIQ
jgi:hypothetical protein